MQLTLPRLDTTDPGDLLAGLRGTAPLSGGDAGQGRLSSLGACITYSFTHLTKQARRLLPAVSLLYGIADENLLMLFSAAEGVPSRFAGVRRQEWTAVLRDAARVGLLTRIGASIYQVHPALPGYLAAGWHADSPGGYGPEREASEQALRIACANLSQWLTRQVRSEDAALAYTIIGLQRRTLGAMLGHALDDHAWDDANSIVRALNAYWETRGLGEEAAAWTDRILDATSGHAQAPPGPASSLWLYTLTEQAGRRRDAGQPDNAATVYQQVLAYLQDQPETDWTRTNIPIVYHQLGITAQHRGRLDEAEDWYRKALTIKEGLGDRPGMAISYYQLGMTAQHRGRLDEAEDWYRKALTIEEALDDLPGMADTYHELGITSQLRGRLDEAGNWCRMSLTIKEELGDRPDMALSYNQLGNIAYLRERLDEAEDWYRKALTIEEALGDRPGMADTYHQLGITTQDRGRLDEAGDWYRKSLTIKEELGDLAGIALTYGQLGLLAEARQQPRQALDWIVRCVSLLGQIPDPAPGPGPEHLARLTRQLGMPALEEAWRQVTREPVPQAIRDYITSHHDQDSEARRDRPRRRGLLRRRHPRP